MSDNIVFFETLRTLHDKYLAILKEVDYPDSKFDYNIDIDYSEILCILIEELKSFKGCLYERSLHVIMIITQGFRLIGKNLCSLLQDYDIVCHPCNLITLMYPKGPEQSQSVMILPQRFRMCDTLIERINVHWGIFIKKEGRCLNDVMKFLNRIEGTKLITRIENETVYLSVT